jgi:two-component system, chemotaxis family, chemotaxis protein CheY
VPKVLVVEDSSAMRGLIASVIDQIGGCEVVEVPSGYEALRRLPREGFDLVITDINMPDINGLELISFLRKNPAYQKTPVIIISTESSERDREKGLALGANAYVTKPFAPAELTATVKKLLSLP